MQTESPEESTQRAFLDRSEHRSGCQGEEGAAADEAWSPPLGHDALMIDTFPRASLLAAGSYETAAGAAMPEPAAPHLANTRQLPPWPKPSATIASSRRNDYSRKEAEIVAPPDEGWTVAAADERRAVSEPP